MNAQRIPSRTIEGFRPSVALTALLCMASWAGGQTTSAAAGGPAAQDTQVPDLVLKEDPELPSGKWAGAYGAADQSGLKLGLPSLGVLQPVSLTLVADPAHPMKIEIFKFGFKEPVRTGSTGREGLYNIRFRTEGGVTLRLAGENGPSQYAILAWVGEEVSDTGPGLLVRRASHRANSERSTGAPAAASSGNRVLLIAVAALLSVVVVLLVLLARRRSAPARTGVVVAAMICGTSALSLGSSSPVSLGNLKEFNKKLDEFGKGEKKLLDLGIQVVKDLPELKNWLPLTPEDEGYEANYNPPGSPQLEASCVESPECKSCFEPAYKNLNKLRFRFEKLRRIYTSTKKMTQRAVAFGDSASSFNGILGLAWQAEKVKIDQSVKGLETSYDKKYKELMDELKKVLQQLAECEAKVYGDPNWYNRFGFIYYQFMADRYLRGD